ncbi:Glycine rich protein [Actinidia chinensis var. chinensis]|uniref:Glycine rich protein n=1 Tax=Actinidia chinensis var. chinensis TaxID=1590841 RepID=A0A2R6QCT9_ACTCC|nr:Glycine rich protein [Actinidia chinensis var. chinensis]
MKSGAFVLLGLLFAVLFLISSVVAEETSKEEKKEVETKEPNQQYGGGQHCPSGCCGYGPYGRCRWCCRNADEARAFELAQANSYRESGYYGGGGYGGGWGGGHGGGGYGGGGHSGWGGGGGRCCGNAEEAKSKGNEAKHP